MKSFISFLLCLSIAPFIYAQVINYDVDSEFDSAQLLTKGHVSDIALLLNNESLIIGEFNDFASPVHSGCIINQVGQMVQLMNYGGPSVVKYGNSFLQHGGVLRKYSMQGIDSDFYFEYRKEAYSGFVPDQETIAFVTPEDNILVGGIFFTDSTDISTNSLRQLCMIDSTGAPIPDFPMVKCEPYNARIYSIDTLSTGEYIIAGSFSSVNGHPTNIIAKLHSDFSVDTSFGNVFGNQSGGVVGEIDSMDRIWIRIGDGYLSSNPDSSIYFLRLLPNGEVDTSFQVPTFTSYYDASNPFETGPATMALLDDNTILLGGNFVEVNGEYHKTMVQLYSDGSIVEGAFDNLGADEAVWDGWEPTLGPIAGTFVRIIQKLPDGKLLLGGSFSSFGGEPYNCLVRLKPDGFVGVADNKPREKLTIYPNPADNTIHITLPNQNQNLERLRFFDLSGRQVLEVNHPNKGVAIDVSALSDGLYLVEGRTGEGNFCGKVVINKR